MWLGIFWAIVQSFKKSPPNKGISKRTCYILHIRKFLLAFPSNLFSFSQKSSLPPVLLDIYSWCLYCPLSCTFRTAYGHPSPPQAFQSYDEVPLWHSIAGSSFLLPTAWVRMIHEDWHHSSLGSTGWWKEHSPGSHKTSSFYYWPCHNLTSLNLSFLTCKWFPLLHEIIQNSEGEL